MRKLAAVSLGAMLLGSGTLPAASPEPAGNAALVERGRYLAVVGDCAACHTADKGKPFAGGRPIETPFGVILAPNITPDRETGIGSWSAEDFVAVLQRGIGRGGKHLYPAMPYGYTTHVSRADDLALQAWFATVPAVRNKVVANRLPFPLDIRAAIVGWNALYFTPGEWRPDPAKSAVWNRGAYLVEGLEHCGACHTPKRLLGADDTSRRLRGNTLQGWFAPNITDDDRQGLGRWSVDDIVAYLATGHNRFAAASGPMAEEVAISSSQMHVADLRAIAVYLKDQPGQSDAPQPADPSGKAMRLGRAIYADECSSCHTPDGGGIAGLFPALAGAPAVQSRAPTSIIRVVLRGAQDVATAPAPTGAAMPAFGWMLSDEQVAAVGTYIRNAWGNAASEIGAGDVASARAALAKRTD